MDHQKTIEKLVAWIRTNTPAGAKVLIPVSGGSDSALAFWLYAQAVPGRVKAVYCGANLRAKEWFEATGDVLYSDLAIENGKNAEIERWAHFLTLAIQENRILVGSRNRTEDTLGTFSHASKVCMHLPLAGTWKSEVMALCEFVGVPAEIIASSRQADPACGRPKRMADIPFGLVDAFLQNKQGAKIPLRADASQLTYLEKTYAANAYKKQLPLKNL